MEIKRFSLILAILLVCSCPALAMDASDLAKTDVEHWFQAIRSYRIAFSSPLLGLKLVRDAGVFEFKSGRIDILEPVRGRYHTAVFEGEGIFRLEPPTRIEKNQLIKFAKCEKLEEEFNSAVLRFTDTTAEEILAALGVESIPETQEPRPSTSCQEAMKRVMKEYLRNIDSRVLCNIVAEERGYFFAAIDSKTKGEFTFEIGPIPGKRLLSPSSKKRPLILSIPGVPFI